MALKFRGHVCEFAALVTCNLVQHCPPEVPEGAKYHQMQSLFSSLPFLELAMKCRLQIWHD